jgi:hypothetical protein
MTLVDCRNRCPQPELLPGNIALHIYYRVQYSDLVTISLKCQLKVLQRVVIIIMPTLMP